MRYHAIFITPPASLPLAGVIFVPHITPAFPNNLYNTVGSILYLFKQSTEITKLAPQENCKGYNKWCLLICFLAVAPPLTVPLLTAGGCLSDAMPTYVLIYFIPDVIKRNNKRQKNN
jgi:hypothetical protein